MVARSWNLGNILVVVGVVALGATLAVPYATARRVAAVEGDAERRVMALFAASKTLGAIGTEPARQQALFAAVRGSAPDDLHVLDLAAAPGPLEPGIYLEDEHYCYAIRQLPRDVVREGAQAGPEDRVLEVYAWPRSYFGPGRTAFYFPADGPAAFSRNLHARYSGLERVPRHRGARRRDPRPAATPEGPARMDYRGEDDERWLEFLPRELR